MDPKRGCPSSPESSIRARDVAGLSRENFTAYQEKQWFWGLKFHVLPVKGGRTVSAHPAHGAGRERRKTSIPGTPQQSKATAETRAVEMTYIDGFSSFDLTASKNSESFSKSSGCHGSNTKAKIFFFCRNFSPKDLGYFEETSSKWDLNHHQAMVV